MFRFIHTSDWQLKVRFPQFEAKGNRPREARLDTHERTLTLAQELAIEASQVINLTCRPDRYRGVGQAITHPP
jgi:hypothetical protein